MNSPADEGSNVCNYGDAAFSIKKFYESKNFKYATTSFPAYVAINKYISKILNTHRWPWRSRDER